MKTYIGTVNQVKKNGNYSVTLKNGSVISVHKNFNCDEVGVGGEIKFSEMKSLVTLNYSAGSTTWKDSKAIGEKFYKQIL